VCVVLGGGYAPGSSRHRDINAATVAVVAARGVRLADRRLAVEHSAPSAIARRRAQQIVRSIGPKPDQVPKPQSVPGHHAVGADDVGEVSMPLRDELGCSM
jgi:hypothetical protein